LREIAQGTLMESNNRVTFEPSESPLPEVEFEGYYNRDSTKYVGIYNMQVKFLTFPEKWYSG